MRGQAADYDHWRQLGLGGWGWDDVLPAFRRSDHFLGESALHGVGGGWRIEAPRLSWTVLDAVGTAAEEMGIRKIPDFNTGDNEGVAISTSTRSADAAGLRHGLSEARVTPSQSAPRNERTGRSPDYRRGARHRRAFHPGRRDCGSPRQGRSDPVRRLDRSVQVLHRSGIGPADWLAPLGIETILDRQGVGRNLQDHLQQRAIYKVDGVRTLNETYIRW